MHDGCWTYCGSLINLQMTCIVDLKPCANCLVNCVLICSWQKDAGSRLDQPGHSKLGPVLVEPLLNEHGLLLSCALHVDWVLGRRRPEVEVVRRLQSGTSRQHKRQPQYTADTHLRNNNRDERVREGVEHSTRVPGICRPLRDQMCEPDVILSARR